MFTLLVSAMLVMEASAWIAGASLVIGFAMSAYFLFKVKTQKETQP